MERAVAEVNCYWSELWFSNSDLRQMLTNEQENSNVTKAAVRNVGAMVGRQERVKALMDKKKGTQLNQLKKGRSRKCDLDCGGKREE